MNTIIVFDFETDGKDPYKCQPVQLAACAINAKTLEIKENGYFSSDMKPDDPSLSDDDTIDWHAKIKGCKREDVLKRWDKAPAGKHVFDLFVKFVHEHNWKKNKFSAPVPAGHNINKFDLIILDRMIAKYGMDKDYLFHPRDVIDTVNISMLWMESLAEPKSYSMDVLRPFFGFSSEGSHDAIKDVEDCAQLVIKYMRLFRRIAPTIKFKGSFADAA